MNIEEKLLNGNATFYKNMRDNISKSQLNEELIKEQKPYALIITCSDSRVIPEEIFNVSIGELFVIRTAGNVINEGELASIEYGIKHLNIEYVLVLGHTSCGAIHAAIHDEKGEYLHPILSRIKNSIKDNKDERLCSIINAKEEAKFIKSKFPSYKGQVKAGLYDIATNKVEIL